MVDTSEVGTLTAGSKALAEDTTVLLALLHLVEHHLYGEALQLCVDVIPVWRLNHVFVCSIEEAVVVCCHCFRLPHHCRHSTQLIA